MRFFVLILLVLLLPLRGGMSDAMAAGSHHGMTPPLQTQTHTEHALEDCAGHMGHSGQAANTPPTRNEAQAPVPLASPLTLQTATALGDCDACSACQTCHTVALVFSAQSVQPLPAPHAAPAAASLQFASAPAARDQKPPIS